MRKKIVKKCTVLFLVLVLTVSAFSGCGGGGGRDREIITLVVYTQLANFSGMMETGWAAEVMREKFGVQFLIINEVDGTFQTRMQDGFLGDLILFGSNGRQYMDAANFGFLFDWDEDDLLRNYGPFIYEHMQLALNANRNLHDGRLFGFGHNVAADAEDHEDFFYYPYLRWDLYVALGKPPINTLEDLIDVLYAMRELEPYTPDGLRTFGVSFFPDWDGDMVMMVKSTPALYGFDEFGLGLYCTITQTYQPIFTPIEEGGMYLRALRFYNQLFQRGLVDPDSMTQTFNDMIEKYTRGQAFWNIFSWMASPFNTEENMAAGRAMMPVAAADQRNIVYGLNVFGGNRMWAIGSNSAHPELVMEIINWFATPEGVLTYLYGPQGLMWDYDEDGYLFLTDLGTAAQQDGSTEITFGNWTGEYSDGTFQHNNTTWSSDALNLESRVGETFNHNTWRNTLENQVIHPIEQSWRDHFNAMRADDYLIDRGKYSVSIGSAFVFDTLDTRMQFMWDQVTMTVRNRSWEAIYAPNDAEFDRIVALMIQEAYDFGWEELREWNAEQGLRRRAAEDEARGIVR